MSLWRVRVAVAAASAGIYYLGTNFIEISGMHVICVPVLVPNSQLL